MNRILKDNFYKLLPEYGLNKNLLSEFKPHVNVDGIALFYEITAKYAKVIKTFLKDFSLEKRYA